MAQWVKVLVAQADNLSLIPAMSRGLGPDARQRLLGGSAAGQRGREAHGGPEQPPSQGDG